MCPTRRLFLSLRALRPCAVAVAPKPGDVRVKPRDSQMKKGNKMSIWIFLMIIAGWVLLQAYILPKFGIST